MAKIQLTASELLSQSSEMEDLKSQYETLFADMENTLKHINASWSANLENSFSGKIIAVKNSFAKVTRMLEVGAQAASSSAVTFESVDKKLAELYGGAGGEATKSGHYESGESTAFPGQAGEHINDIWDVWKKVAALLGSGKDISQVLEVFKELKQLDGVADYFKEINDLSLFKVIGYLGDTETLIKAIEENNLEGVDELIQKYVKKVVKCGIEETAKEVGVGGFEFDLAWEFGKNMGESIGIIDQSIREGKGFEGVMKAVFNVAQTPVELGYDYAKKITKAFGVDLDERYEAEIGESGVKGLYAAVGEMIDYTKDFGVGAFVDVLGNTASGWGKGIGKLLGIK